MRAVLCLLNIFVAFVTNCSSLLMTCVCHKFGAVVSTALREGGNLLQFFEK